MLKKIQTWIDNITTGVAAVMIAVMFVVIIANVILRAIPAVGGFKWYMEAGIAVQGTNLRVEAVDSIAKRIPYGEKIAKILVDISLIAFYAIMTASGRVISQKAIQAVSTMPKFRMGQVYSIFPVAGVLCIIAAVVHLLVTLTEKPEKKEAAEK